MMSKALIFWFTGLSGSGKSTVAKGVHERLEKIDIKVLILDGDEIRTRTHKHLGFTPKEIKENNRLITELCAENRNEFDVIMVPIISPYSRSRSVAREKFGNGFYEILFNVPLKVLEDRDTKGLYGKANRGEIDNLIGVSQSNPYEYPEKPDLTINTAKETVGESIDLLTSFIISQYNNNHIL